MTQGKVTRRGMLRTTGGTIVEIMLLSGPTGRCWMDAGSLLSAWRTIGGVPASPKPRERFLTYNRKNMIVNNMGQ